MVVIVVIVVIISSHASRWLAARGNAVLVHKLTGLGVGEHCVFEEHHSPVRRVCHSGLVGFAAVSGHQVAQRYAGRVPCLRALIQDGEPALGVPLRRFGLGLCAGAVTSRSCATVCSKRRVPATLIRRSRAPGMSSNSVIAAASVRLSWPLASASIAVLDWAAVLAALMVSLATDNFLATLVTDIPASIICDAACPLGVGEVLLLIVGDDLVHDALDGLLTGVGGTGRQHVNRNAG